VEPICVSNVIVSISTGTPAVFVSTTVCWSFERPETEARVLLTGDEAGAGFPSKSCCPSREIEKGPYPGLRPPVISNPVPIVDSEKAIERRLE
jgi:hypothetical protein